MTLPILGVAGWKNSGKTTLVSGLVRELSSRGLRIATVKHAHHGFDLDHPGKDTFLHRQAGAAEVAIVSSKRLAIMRELRDEPEPTLRETIALMSPCDLVIVEGWKWEGHPKIETRRLTASDTAPLPPEANVIAIAADHPVASPLPVFAQDALAAIADFVVDRFQLRA